MNVIIIFFVKGVKILLTHIEVNFGAHVWDVFVKGECGSGERERGCESSCVCVGGRRQEKVKWFNFKMNSVFKCFNKNRKLISSTNVLI